MTALLKYIIVGTSSNIILIVLYLLCRQMDVSSYLSISIIYMLGLIYTFSLNATWTFQTSSEHKFRKFFYYLALYFFGMALNLLVIFLGADLYSYDDRVIQVFFVLVWSAISFIIQKKMLF